jgi:hypothetical protein
LKRISLGAEFPVGAERLGEFVDEATSCDSSFGGTEHGKPFGHTIDRAGKQRNSLFHGQRSHPQITSDRDDSDRTRRDRATNKHSARTALNRGSARTDACFA